MENDDFFTQLSELAKGGGSVASSVASSNQRRENLLSNMQRAEAGPEKRSKTPSGMTSPSAVGSVPAPAQTNEEKAGGQPGLPTQQVKDFFRGLLQNRSDAPAPKKKSVSRKGQSKKGGGSQKGKTKQVS